MADMSFASQEPQETTRKKLKIEDTFQENGVQPMKIDEEPNADVDENVCGKN